MHVYIESGPPVSVKRLSNGIPTYLSTNISDRPRCRMGDDAIEALECLKNWQRDRLVAATKQDIKVIEDMLNASCKEDLP